MTAWREAAVPSFAKVNLALRVLHKRDDGFHEIRSIFQTIDLKDEIRVRFRSGGESKACTDVNADIPSAENLSTKAALAFLRHTQKSGSVEIEIAKKIPMGGGLGGGSSNAAAVLLALPALTRTKVTTAELLELAAGLGSDVPFFLLGGTAAGAGRGEQLYPLPDGLKAWGWMFCPGILVSTPEAYRALGRTEDASSFATIVYGFQSLTWQQPFELESLVRSGLGENDFEPAVFSRHPEIQSVRRELKRSGASIALMSGSGSSVFGLFPSRDSQQAAGRILSADAIPFRLLSRSQYRSIWLKRLAGHCKENLWPPIPSRGIRPTRS